MDITKKLGQIKIKREFTHDFQLMSKILQKFIPLSINYDIANSTYIYKGYSPEFYDHIEGKPIPFYEVIASYDRDEVFYDQINISISFDNGIRI